MKKLPNPNLWKQAIKAGTTFKKWKSWNPNGRPKKGISYVNDQLSKEWYKPATRQDIEANYMAMVQLPQAKLKAFTEDKDKPMLVRIIAKAMLSGKGFDVIEKMLDRGIGKAVQRDDLTVKGSLTLADWLIALTKVPQKEEK